MVSDIADQNVIRLQVVMNQPLLVQIIHRIQDLCEKPPEDFM